MIIRRRILKPIIEQEEIEYEFVGLGLPSGLLWADRNVGATSETDYGLYFQWGDIIGYTSDQVGDGEDKKYFGWEDYKYSENGTAVMTKYNTTDNKTVLDLEDDAAAFNMGGKWRMPTAEEFQELIDNTNSSWVTNYNNSGKAGRLFTSKNDSSKSIFFPAAGNCYNGSVNYVDSRCNYWSSSLGTRNVSSGRYLYAYSNNVVMATSNRNFGFSVRAIRNV